MPTIDASAAKVALDATQLSMLLDGIDVARVRRPRHWEPPADRTKWDMDDMDTPKLATTAIADRRTGPSMIKAQRCSPSITTARGVKKPSVSEARSRSMPR
jgi:hypothetical protein